MYLISILSSDTKANAERVVIKSSVPCMFDRNFSIGTGGLTIDHLQGLLFDHQLCTVPIATRGDSKKRF